MWDNLGLGEALKCRKMIWPKYKMSENGPKQC